MNQSIKRISGNQKLLRDIFGKIIPDYAIEITKLELKPDDIIVLKLRYPKNKKVKKEEIDQLVKILERILPKDVKGLIIDSRKMELAIIEHKD